MGYVGRHSIGERFAAECVGTALFTFLALSAMGNQLLPRTKGHAMGFAWVAVAFGAALGINMAAFAPISDYFNPGVVIGHAMAGNVDWMDVPALCLAEFLGAFVGAAMAWLHLSPHFRTKPDAPTLQPKGYFFERQDEIRMEALQMASYSSDPVAWRQRNAFQNTMQEVKRYLEDGPVTAAHNMKNRRRNSVQIGEINRRHCIDPDFKDAKQESQLRRLERGNSIVVADLKRYLERLEELERARQVALNAPLPDKKEHQADNVALLESDGMQELVKTEDLAIMADQNIKLSVFATRPALYAPCWNLGCEISASALLVFFTVTFSQHFHTQVVEAGAIVPQMFGTKALCSAMLLFGIMVGLGGPTGPAMSASRDLSPRLVHFLFPIPGKGRSEWEYAWVPIVGNFVGGGIAGMVWLAFARLSPT